MGIGDILKLAGGLGPTVTLLFLILAIGIGIGILVITVKNLAKNLQAQNAHFIEAVADLKRDSDRRDEKLEKLIAEQNLRLSYIEQRFASKEDMYEALGGWKYEVNELRSRIDRHVEQAQKIRGTG